MRWCFSIILLLIFFPSCKQQETKVKSSGRSGELLIVMREELWNSSVADAIQSGLGADQYGLPQSEPLFRLVRVNKNDFTGLLRQHRNILMAEIEGSEPKLSYQKDIWAQPQIVIKATAPDTVMLEMLLATQAEQLIKYFNKEELERILAGYRKLNEKNIERTIQDEFDLKIVIPEGYYLASHKVNFMWLRRETPDVSQGLLIYERPYVDTSDASYNKVIKMRDSLTALYVPGPEENTFMITEKKFPASFTPVEINNYYTLEMRGLWRTKGYFMGGPFINYTIIDNKKNRILTLDGFVFAPRFDKREYLRQLEAIIYSAELQ